MLRIIVSRNTSWRQNLSCRSSKNSSIPLEGTQWGLSVVGPISPGRPSQAVLEKHADDGHHCQPSVSEFRIKLLFLDLRVGNSLATQVSRKAQESILVVGGLLTKQTSAKLSRWVGWHLMHQPQVADSAEDGVLEPTNCRNLGGCRKAVGNVGELDFAGRRNVARESEELLDDVSLVQTWAATSHSQETCLRLSLSFQDT